jgi:hypothetical protein
MWKTVVGLSLINSLKYVAIIVALMDNFNQGTGEFQIAASSHEFQLIE